MLNTPEERKQFVETYLETFNTFIDKRQATIDKFKRQLPNLGKEDKALEFLIESEDASLGMVKKMLQILTPFLNDAMQVEDEETTAPATNLTASVNPDAASATTPQDEPKA